MLAPLSRNAAGGFHIVAVSFDESASSRGSAIVGPLHDDESKYDLVDARSKRCKKHERDQNRWKAELKIDDAHGEAVNAPTDIGGGQPDRRADGESDDSAQDANHYAQTQDRTESR